MRVVSRVKGNQRMEKIFANCVSDKRLISRMYRDLLKCSNKKQSGPLKNQQRSQINISPKQVYKWSVNPWKDARCHCSSAKCKPNHNEIPPHTIEMAAISTPENNKCWGNVGKWEPLCPAGWVVKWCSCSWKQYGGSSKIKQICQALAHQAPQFMGFSRQKFWSRLPCPPPGDLPNLGIETKSLTSPVLAGRFLTTSTTWEARFAIWSSNSTSGHISRRTECRVSKR